MISTLRESKIVPKTQGSVEKIAVDDGASAEHNIGSMIPNPPSFYEEDLRKKVEKYSKAIKERQIFKQKYLKDQNLAITTGAKDIEGSD